MKENSLNLASKNKDEGIQIELEIPLKTGTRDCSGKLFDFEKFRKNKADEEYYRKVEESVEKLKEKYY